MKKFLLTFCLSLSAIVLLAQAKKPTIMVVPSDLWCNTNGYMMQFDNQGTIVSVPDYVKALQSDINLVPVIAKINDLMADRGFPLKNMESEIKSINNDNAELNMLQSKNGGEVVISPIDQLRQRAKADIILQLTWIVNKVGPKYSVQYTLQGLDAYTNKQIAGETGVGPQTFTADVASLLNEAVNTHMDNFCDRLQNHFDDLLDNGREIKVNVRVFDTAPFNLEDEINGEELLEIIDNWMNDNTVNHRYSLSSSSENYMDFEQVRIPIYDERGRAMDANRYGRELVRFLKGDPYKIENIKLLNRGLGEITLVLGDK